MLKNIHKILLTTVLVAASPMHAQEAAPAATDLSTGEDLKNTAPAEPEVVSEQIGDWTVNCQQLEQGENCQMTQLLKDSSDTPVVEVNLFPVPGNKDVFAGGSIMAPLETLLTAQLTVSVDDSLAKRYPFAFCMPQGCVSRIGLTEQDINSYKKGAEATVTIVPAAAADQKVALTMSLTGFTKAFEAMSK